MRTLLQSLYAPVFWFGFIGAATVVLQAPGASPLWLVPLGALAVAMSFAAEALWPYDPRWNRPRGDARRDVAHALTNESLNLIGLQFWTAAALVAERLGPNRIWPTELPFAVQVLLAILVCDLGITLAHFLSHRWRPLWRLHAVHHSVKRMYGFNGLMKHPLHQAVEAAAGFTPLLLLGAPQPVVLGVAFATVVQLLLQHSNVDMKLGPLRHVFAFAPVHRLHHLKYGKAGDVNFGFFFCLWDRLLGTAMWVGCARIRTQDLGIGGRPDYPVRYWAQLREPFWTQPPEGPSPPLPNNLRRL